MKHIFKVDLDIKLPKKWQEDFIETRKAILSSLGLKCTDIIVRPSRYRGSHYYIHAEGRKLTPEEYNEIQMLLGDDRGRVLINATRIKRGIDWEHGNKLFAKVIWRKEHKCNCSIHQKIIRRIKKGQKDLLGD